MSDYTRQGIKGVPQPSTSTTIARLYELAQRAPTADHPGGVTAAEAVEVLGFDDGNLGSRLWHMARQKRVTQHKINGNVARYFADPNETLRQREVRVATEALRKREANVARSNKAFNGSATPPNLQKTEIKPAEKKPRVVVAAPKAVKPPKPPKVTIAPPLPPDPRFHVDPASVPRVFATLGPGRYLKASESTHIAKVYGGPR